MTINQKLANYIEAVARANPDDGKTFRELLCVGFGLLHLSEEGIARRVDVSKPSVVRWTKGETSPHPVVRKLVYRDLLEQATRRFLACP